ncbi:hypothetical protein [Alkalimonas sp.]|uniref:hypothetical protein n=1 Tax=Alkalimonas sp. TaxID=1872453 RepID=UPI00263AC203|nr:hypothetical protein [Alkalimonas sp.]MCC5827400.1 hypothetical protein [Alkalimonas sp.]
MATQSQQKDKKHHRPAKRPGAQRFLWSSLLTVKGIWGLWLALLLVVPLGNGLLWLTGLNTMTELRPSAFLQYYYPPGVYQTTLHYHDTITYSGPASATDRTRVWKTTLANRYLHVYREGEATIVVKSDKPKPAPYYLGSVSTTPRLLRQLPPAKYEMIAADELAPFGFSARESWLGRYLFFVHWLPLYGEKPWDE